MNPNFNFAKAARFLVWIGYDYDEVGNMSESDIFTFYQYEVHQYLEETHDTDF